MTIFKNRFGHAGVLFNQSDLGQRRRGLRANPEAALDANALQSPAGPALHRQQMPAAPQAAPTVDPAAAGTRRRRQQVSGQHMTGQPAAAPQLAAPIQASAPTQQAVLTETPQAQDAAPGRRRAQMRNEVLQTATEASARARENQLPSYPAVPALQARQMSDMRQASSSAPAAPRQSAMKSRQIVTDYVAENSMAISAEDQARLEQDRAERRKTRLVSPNMTWKSLADVPKPAGPLNAQMLQVTRLIEVGIELAEMVEEENMQMAKGNVRMLGDHQAHKSELSSAYIQTMNSLRAHPPALKEDNMPLIQFMKDVASRVQTALDTHMSMCRAAMSMTEHLIGKIRKDVAAHDGQTLQYKNPLLGQRMRRSSQERVSAVAHNTLV